MYRQIDGPAAYGNKIVTTTPQVVRVGASNLLERTVVWVQPVDGLIYYGFDSSVSASNGFKVFKDQLFEHEVGDLLDVYIVAASGSVNVRIAELA